MMRSSTQSDAGMYGSAHAMQFTFPPSQPTQTSLDAARAIKAQAPTLRLKVLSLLRQHPEGLTDEAIQRQLGMDPNTERPRRIELTRANLVEDSGERRKTAAGRFAVVWRAV